MVRISGFVATLAAWPKPHRAAIALHYGYQKINLAALAGTGLHADWARGVDG